MILKRKKQSRDCGIGIYIPIPSNSFIRIFLCISCVLLMQTGCKKSSHKSIPDSSISPEDPFPEKTQIQYATGFTIEYHDNYKIVNILNHFEDDVDTLKYVLVQRGTTGPTHYSNSQHIQIPVRNLVVMSSVHIALVDFAESIEILKALGNLKYVSNEQVKRNIEAGKIAEVGSGGSMNDELLISMQPDLVMATGSPEATFSRYQTLVEAGVPVLINTGWLEDSPLGRAEWVKLVGALLNKEALVNKKFAAVEKEYEALRLLAQQAENGPTIVEGMPYKGSWFLPDGDSYFGQFLEDAVTTYNWSDTRTKGTLSLDFEAVYPVALEAEFWLNIGNVNSKEEIAAKDVRFTDFKAFKKGAIYNNNKRVNERGANDYWESGSVNPQVILADLIKIFHPELLPKHELFYYKNLK